MPEPMTPCEQHEAWKELIEGAEKGSSSAFQLRAATSIYATVGHRAALFGSQVSMPLLIAWPDMEDYDENFVEVEIYAPREACIVLSFQIYQGGWVNTSLLEPYHECAGDLLGIDDGFVFMLNRVSSETLLMIDRFVSLCPTVKT